MADITAAINEFKTAVIGRDVREGFVKTMTLVNADNIVIKQEQADIKTKQAAADIVNANISASLTSAQTNANAAAASASSATVSMNQATGYASQASAAAGTVQSKVDAATAAANTATTKATETAGSATQAAASATTAATKAGEAAISEATAQDAAGTAITKASEAAVSAETAATSATTAGTKASDAAESAATAQTAASAATEKATAAESSATAAAASAAAAEMATGITAEKIASWDAKEDAANKGVAGGYAALDNTGKVPASQLPIIDGHTHSNKAILDKIITGAAASYNLDDFGQGDMKKTTYDTNDSGVVDNAEKVNGHTVAVDVPVGAKFTDTTYTAADMITAIMTVDGDGSGLDADLLDGKNAADFALTSHGTHVTYGAATTALTSGGTGAVGSASSLARSDHTHTLPAYPDLATHSGNTNIHTTAEKQTEWNKNTTDIALLQSQTGTLSGNDAASRKEILDIKLKLDELNVVEFLNKTGIGFFDLFEDTSNIDSGNTTATMASTDVTFTGEKILQMNQQTFSGFTNVDLAIYDLQRETFTVNVAVNNSATISMNITPGSRTVGEKFYYNGAVYTITGVTAS